jgi:hypothetical protein
MIVKSWSISAISTLALVMAGIGQCRATVLSWVVSQQGFLDLIQDDAAAAGTGDLPGRGRDPIGYALAALEMTRDDIQTASLSGSAGRAASARAAFTTLPLGASSGTNVDEPAAKIVIGGPETFASQNPAAVGRARLESFIGTVGDGPVATDRKPGGTVFLQPGSRYEFRDPTFTARATKDSSARYPMDDGRTAIAMDGVLSRQQTGGTASVQAARRPGVATTPVDDTVTAPARLDATRLATIFGYAPPVAGPGNNASVSASFGIAITASRALAPVESKATGAVRIGQAQLVHAEPSTGGRGQALWFDSVDAVVKYYRFLDYTRIAIPARAAEPSGIRSYLSPSVSADPMETATHYLAAELDRASVGTADMSVQGFFVGTPVGALVNLGAPAAEREIVPAPLDDRMIGGAGPLDNSLALP